jgi:hypothetical protein
MKIQYIHASDPETVKTYDTVRVYNNPNNGPRVFATQEDFDNFELRHFAEDKERGTIVAFKILKEEFK